MKTVIRSQAMLDAAENMSCVNCGTKDGTVVAAHYQGLHASEFGKGKGIKPHDICVADLCQRCHRDFDGYLNSYEPPSFHRKVDLSEQFLTCIMRTLIRRVDQGVITVKGRK